MTSELYSREAMNIINKNNQYSSKLMNSGNISDIKNLNYIVNDRRNNSSDVKREKIGKDQQNINNNNLNKNDNDKLLSKFITQMPQNSSRPLTVSNNLGLVVDNDSLK